MIRHLTRSQNFVSILSLNASKRFRNVASCHFSQNIDVDKALRNDVKKFGIMLGNAIRTEDPEVFESVERLRKLGRDVSSNSAH
jgi:hypothetical protein